MKIVFLKSIIVGLGGIAPGLSGSVLMILFGLYQDVLEALGTLFTIRRASENGRWSVLSPDFKEKIRFLFPILGGMGVGVLLFSKLLHFFLTRYEVPTRFAFLGLILGTVPLFYREVKKQGFSKRYYIVIALAVVAGTWLFTLNADMFEQVTDPNLLQKLLLGIAVAASAIVPGIDPAVLLSSLGLYETYVSALANLELHILLPMVLGLCIGGVGISFLMSGLFRHFYTASFSVVFGIFLSMIPHMLNETCYLALDIQSAVSMAVLGIVFLISYHMGNLEEKHKRE